MTSRIVQALIQHHHNVATEGQLDVYGRFGREEVLVTIQVRAEDHTFVRDLAQSIQAEDLETTRVGENRPRPLHELMQAAKVPDSFVAGAKEKMIGVAQDDLSVEIVEQIPGEHGFYGSLGADGHEHRRFDIAMSCMKNARTGARFRANGL